MNKIKYYILPSLIAFFGVFAFVNAQTVPVFRGSQGGTGISSTVVGNIASCLKVLSVNPLRWTIGSCGSGGGGSSTVLYPGSNIVLNPDPINVTGTIAVTSTPTFTALTLTSGDLTAQNGNIVSTNGTIHGAALQTDNNLIMGANTYQSLDGNGLIFNAGTNVLDVGAGYMIAANADDVQVDTSTLDTFIKAYGYVTSTVSGGGSVSTSSPITTNNFPFWTTVGGALSGTSTLTVTLWNAIVASTTPYDAAWASSSYISALLASSTKIAWLIASSTKYDASTTYWDSGYNQRLQWDGGATNLVAATGRTSLGLTDTAITASSTFCKVANNLSDLNASATARTNLGLGVNNAILVGGATGIASAYAGSSCTAGSMVTTISATGTATCQTTSTVLAGYITTSTPNFGQVSPLTRATTTLWWDFSVANTWTGVQTINSLLFTNATGSGNLGIATLKPTGISTLQAMTFTNATGSAGMSVAQTSTFAQGLSVGTTTLPSGTNIFSVVSAGTSTIQFGNASTSKPACVMFSDYPTGTTWTYVWTRNGTLYTSSSSCSQT